jgi:hypothetical protein
MKKSKFRAVVEAKKVGNGEVWDGLLLGGVTHWRSTPSRSAAFAATLAAVSVDLNTEAGRGVERAYVQGWNGERWIYMGDVEVQR